MGGEHRDAQVPDRADAAAVAGECIAPAGVDAALHSMQKPCRAVQRTPAGGEGSFCRPGSGAAALEAATREPPQLAMIDLGLGDMSGLDLLAQLRQRPAAADCLFLCVSGRDSDTVSWREAGIHHFLQKPVELRLLLGLLDDLLERERGTAKQTAD